MIVSHTDSAYHYVTRCELTAQHLSPPKTQLLEASQL